MGKQILVVDDLQEEAELLARLKEHCSRYYDLVYAARPTKQNGDETIEMSSESINQETDSLVGLVGEILEIPEREPLEESEILAIHNLLENGAIKLKALQKLYRRNKVIAL